MDASPLAAWVNERHAIYIRKELRAGTLPEALYTPDQTAFDLSEADPYQYATYPAGPVSSDPIFQCYRFCNVFRELDRVTLWIDKHIRRRYADHPNLWTMLAIARTINWPDTLQGLMDTSKSEFNDLACWPDHPGFSPEDLGIALDARSASGNKVYTGAYMIRAESNPNAPWYNWTKQEYIAQIVLGRLWEDRARFSAALDPELRPGFSALEATWDMFQEPRYIGWGPFMAYQVVVDLRHTRYLRGAKDINSWAALGPGSRRGLNRLAGRSIDYPLKQDEGLAEMLHLWRHQDTWRAPWVPPIDLSDIQNALCETDKYLRVKQGEGKPRAKYVQGRGW